MNFGAKEFKFKPGGGYVGLTNASSDHTQNSPNMNDGSVKAVKRPKNAPMCVIVEPTKELAQQTFQEINNFKKFLDNPKIKFVEEGGDQLTWLYRNVLVSGGMSSQDQINALSNGCDIITCTPGRVRDLLSQQLISMSHVRFFVLDEADFLMSGKSDSIHIIRELHGKIPHYSSDGQRLQMIVCSATLHNFEVNKLAASLSSTRTLIAVTISE